MMGEDMPAFTSARTSPSGDIVEQLNNSCLAWSNMVESRAAFSPLKHNIQCFILKIPLVLYSSLHERLTCHQSLVTTAWLKP
jgi:hypothetical protein